jgi:hypothetical protein
MPSLTTTVILLPLTDLVAVNATTLVETTKIKIINNNSTLFFILYLNIMVLGLGIY